MLACGLFPEIAQIEEQHVTHYASLLAPSASWYERLVLHEYNECHLPLLHAERSGYEDEDRLELGSPHPGNKYRL